MRTVPSAMGPTRQTLRQINRQGYVDVL